MPNYADALRKAPQQPTLAPQPTGKTDAQKQKTPKKRRTDNDVSKSSQQQRTIQEANSQSQAQQVQGNYAARSNSKPNINNIKTNPQHHSSQNRKKKGPSPAAPKKPAHQQPGKRKAPAIAKKHDRKNHATAPKVLATKSKPQQFLDTSQDAFPALGGTAIKTTPTTRLPTPPAAKPLTGWKPMPPVSNSAATSTTVGTNKPETIQNRPPPASVKPTKIWGKVPVAAASKATLKETKQNKTTSSTEHAPTTKGNKKTSTGNNQTKKSASKQIGKPKKNSTSAHSFLLDKRPDAAFDPTRLGLDMTLFGGGKVGNKKEETKKGRQRIRPRKKKFTTLKKKVLQERLDKWREANPSSEETKSQTSHHQQQQSSVSPCVVCLHNYVEPEELEDEEEYEEIVANLTEMAEKIGPLKSVHIPKPGETNDTAEKDTEFAFLLFERPEDAKAAVACWDGMFLGGQALQAVPVVHNVVFRPEEPNQFWDSVTGEKQLPATTASTIAKDRIESGPKNNEITVALQNVLTEDDFEDEDCLEESLEDIRSMAEEIGLVHNLCAEQSGPENSGLVLITYNSADSAEMAKKAVAKFSGIVIGGATVSAYIVNDKDEKNQSNNTAEITSWLVLENVLTPDDLEDEDCLEETKADIADLAQHYGRVLTLDVDLQAPTKLMKVQLEGADSAALAMEKFNGMVVGGLTIKATVLRQDKQGLSTSEGKSPVKKNENDKKESTPTRMFSGDKLIPERYAECKRVPKIPNATSGPRPYALVTGDENVKKLLVEMLGELMRLQRRAMEDKNAKARRRIVMGLREVARGIRAHKVKMVVVANNLDEYGVIDEKVQTILDLAREESVPMFFEFSKRTLGKALGKSIKVAVVGIQNADGAHQQFKKLLTLDPSLGSTSSTL